MARSKITNYRVKKPLKTTLTIVAILALLFFLLRFAVVAEAVAPVLPWEPEEIMQFADSIFFMLLGLLLVIVGFALMSSLVLAVTIIVLGVALIGIQIWKRFLQKSIVD